MVASGRLGRSTDDGDRTFHPFASTQPPFLAAADLAVFKTLFDRPKDWVDIESMRQARAIDVVAVAEVVRSLVGDDDRVNRLLALADAP